jgi:hypothetical protein
MKKRLSLFAFIFILSLSSKAQFNLVSAGQMGGSGVDAGTHVFIDVSGNVYTTGYFDNNMDVDPGPGVVTLTTAGLEDVYVTKQNSAGTLIWAKSFGGSNTDKPAGIGVDNLGNVYISGWYSGAIDLDPSAATYSFFVGSIEIFVLKLDVFGNFVWGGSMGSGANDKATAMWVDGPGNVYTTGTFEAMADFDPSSGVFQLTPAGSSGSDVFVSKLTTNGAFAWAINLGGIGIDIPYGICMDPLLNVYVTGSFEDVADFDPGAGTFTLQSIDLQDAFVSKVDANGTFVWAKQIGGMGVQEGTGIFPNGTTDIYVTGDFQNSVDFDPGAATFSLSSTASFYSSFALRWSSAGNFTWAKNIGGNNDVMGNKIRSNSTGVFWSGYNKGTADLDPGAGTFTATAVTSFDSYLTVLDPNGNYVAAESFPYEWGAFTLRSNGNILIAGKFTNSRDFDPGAATTNLTSLGQEDACLVELNMSLVSVQQHAKDANEILVYPNPNNGNFEINVRADSQVRIMNSLGQTISEFSAVNGTQSVNLNNCKAGMYVLMINSNGKQTAKRFVITAR